MFHKIYLQNRATNTKIYKCFVIIPVKPFLVVGISKKIRIIFEHVFGWNISETFRYFKVALYIF